MNREIAWIIILNGVSSKPNERRKGKAAQETEEGDAEDEEVVLLLTHSFVERKIRTTWGEEQERHPSCSAETLLLRSLWFLILLGQVFRTNINGNSRKWASLQQTQILQVRLRSRPLVLFEFVIRVTIRRHTTNPFWMTSKLRWIHHQDARSSFPSSLACLKSTLPMESLCHQRYPFCFYFPV